MLDRGVREVDAGRVPALTRQPDNVPPNTAADIQRLAWFQILRLFNQQLVWLWMGVNGLRPYLVPEISLVGSHFATLPDDTNSKSGSTE
jgi:hypothetical protein